MDTQVSGQVLVLFILIALGFASYKLKITTKEAAVYFSSFAMKITLPCMILVSFFRPFSRELLGEAISTLGISTVVYVISLSFALAYPHILRITGPERGVHRYALFNPNSGLIGFPVIEAVLGPSFIFHASMFNIPANIVAFSIGVWIVAKEGKKAPALSWKIFISPLFIVTIVGFVMFSFSLRLPWPIEQSMRAAGSITSPLSMVVIGISIAQADLKQVFGRWRIYVTVIIRLLVIPALVGISCYMAGVRGALLTLPVILTAMPAGSTTSIFATVYDVAVEEAGSIVALSTMLSAFTIPLVVIAVHYFLG